MSVLVASNYSFTESNIQVCRHQITRTGDEIKTRDAHWKIKASGHKENISKQISDQRRMEKPVDFSDLTGEKSRQKKSRRNYG